jgi:hypothetical protein
VLSGHGLAAVQQFVTDFDRLYGAGVLISQRAASVPDTPSARSAMRWLFFIGLGSGLLLIGTGIVAGTGRRRALEDAAAPTGGNNEVGTLALGGQR